MSLLYIGLDSVYWSDLFIGNDRDITFFLHRCESANDKGMVLDVIAKTWTTAVSSFVF